MRVELALHAVTVIKTELLVLGAGGLGALGASMVFYQSPGYVMGGAVASVVFWLMSRKKTIWDRIVLLIFTFAAGAWGAPLVVGMDSMNWLPRPQPMVGEWELLMGLIFGCIGGTPLYLAVVKANRRMSAGVEALINNAADRLGLPDPVTTHGEKPPVMTAEEFQEFVRTLPPEQQAAMLDYAARRAAAAKRKEGGEG